MGLYKPPKGKESVCAEKARGGGSGGSEKRHHHAKIGGNDEHDVARTRSQK